MPKQALVSIEKLCIELGGRAVVSQLSFSIHHNEILGIVGESGSGKSVTAMSLMGLLPSQNRSLKATRMDFDGQSLIPFKENRFRALRGKEIGMIFQDPMSALNPSMRCGKQILEIIALHSPLPKKKPTSIYAIAFGESKAPQSQVHCQTIPTPTEWWTATTGFDCHRHRL